MAVILLVFLLPLIFGVINFCLYLDVRQSLTNASGQALMAAAVHEDPEPLVRSYIQHAGLDVNKYTLNVVRDSDSVSTADKVTVHIDYDLTDILAVPWLDKLPDLKTMRVTAVGRSL
jgi:Flp pilus assembly protein TadG